MKKRMWLLLGLTGILLFSLFYIAEQKPDDGDFKRWMEQKYSISCLDYKCETFQIHTTEDGVPIVMQNVHGSYSPGTFVMEVERAYRNLEDPSYYLEIKVEGFMGTFTTKEETVKNIRES
ncbi:hypothetical protein [Halobacillus litoralis]|uniref:hypothetical protein n=1 Tax=Halobacillus litoralis TaxID=45668 RepID=UPI001CFE6EA6|nr:hypothetical protein [Halobacillus litoralis]